MLKLTTFLIVCGFVWLVTGLVPARALAQTDQTDTQPARPYRGLFAHERAGTEQSLTLLASVGGGYDGNVLGGTAGATPAENGPGQASTFENGSASLAYGFGGGRASFGGSASTNATYYTAIAARPLVVSNSGSLSSSFQLSRRTQLTANVSASFQPFYALPGVPTLPTLADDSGALLTPTLGETVPLDTAADAQLENHLNVTSGITLTHAFSRRVSGSASYAYLSSTSQSHELDLNTQSVGGSLSFQLAKGLALRAGYTQATGRYGSESSVASTTSRGFNGGLDLNRALSISRRTTLTFATGLSAVSNVGPTTAPPTYFLTGQASLARAIGRSWTSALSYARSASFLETFRQPVLSDSVVASTGGLVARRLQTSLSAGVTEGSVGVGGTSANDFRTYFGAAGLQVAITRMFALGADYSYYRYRFGDGVTLPFGLLPQSDRQSIRVYLSLWAPLIGRARRPDATR